MQGGEKAGKKREGSLLFKLLRVREGGKEGKEKRSFRSTLPKEERGKREGRI